MLMQLPLFLVFTWRRQQIYSGNNNAMNVADETGEDRWVEKKNRLESPTEFSSFSSFEDDDDDDGDYNDDDDNDVILRLCSSIWLNSWQRLWWSWWTWKLLPSHSFPYFLSISSKVKESREGVERDFIHEEVARDNNNKKRKMSVKLVVYLFLDYSWSTAWEKCLSFLAKKKRREERETSNTRLLRHFT